MILKKSKLGDVCKIQSGNSIPPKEKDDMYRNVNEGLPYVATKDIGLDGSINFENGVKIPSKFGKKFRLSEKNSVFVCAEGGSAGKKIAYSNKDCYFVNKLFSIKPTNENEIDSKYIYYHTLDNVFQKQFKESLHGLIGGVSLSKIKNFQITYPSLSEQQRIVTKLDTVSKEIDKMINYTKKQILNTHKVFEQSLEKLFNNTDYKEYELSSVCQFIGGSQPPKSHFEYESKKTNIRFIQIRDYKSDKHIVYIPKEKTKKFCTTTDVMIGRYGPPIFQILRGIDGAYNVALMKAVPKKEITNDYLFYFLKNKKIQDYVIKKSIRAAGQSGVNKQALEPYKINLPPIKEQNNIVHNIKIIEEQTYKLKFLFKNKLEQITKLKFSFLKNILKEDKAA